MYLYLVTAGFGEPNFVFDEYKLAEEYILSRIRNTFPCGFSFFIHQRTLNCTNQPYSYHYNGRVKDAGNLRFIEFKVPHEDEIRKEILVKYYGSEREIIDTQLSQINPSSPHSLYFNNKKIISGFSFKIKSKGLIYKNDRIEEVTDEDIKEYFKYKIYLSAYNDENDE